MKNIVKLLDNDIIYVQKVGNQTPDSMIELLQDISRFSVELGNQRKRVLILSNAEEEGAMDDETKKIAAGIGKHLIYDKSATYGASERLNTVRQHMIDKAQLNQKVADFATREEAVEWLLK